MPRTKWGSAVTDALCRRCEQPGRVKGEQYCKDCRSEVLKALREQAEMDRTRTIASKRAEQLGRKRGRWGGPDNRP